MDATKNPGASAEPGSRRAEAGAMSGHLLRTPDGRQIPVDYQALRELQRAGLLSGRRTRILPGIYAALTRGLLSDRTRRHLGGMELTGPDICVCDCWMCQPGRTRA